MSAPENPLAFAAAAGGDNQCCQPGMSLRDWFAGQAITMCLKDMNLGYEAWAQEAYAVADAMLSERAKAGQP